MNGIPAALNVSAVAKTLIAQATQALMRSVGLGFPASAVMADVAGTNADTTMAANTRYDVDMSAWATADRIYTLPTDAAAGDEIEIYAQLGNASFELILKTGTGQTCTFAGVTVAAETEIIRLFIAGERTRFKYIATNKWECVVDARVRQKALIRLSTNATGETAATWSLPTSLSGVFTADIDNASLTTVASSLIKTRRTGSFALAIGGVPASSVNDAATFAVLASKNGTTPTIVIADSRRAAASSGAGIYAGVSISVVSLAADDTLQFMFHTSQGTRGLLSSPTVGLLNSFLSMNEVL